MKQAIVILFVGLAFAATGYKFNSLSSKVTQLEHACSPVDTGGGVTQCSNPSESDLALRSCLGNPAYIGESIEDTLNLLKQCLDDYKEAH